MKAKVFINCQRIYDISWVIVNKIDFLQGWPKYPKSGGAWEKYFFSAFSVYFAGESGGLKNFAKKP